MQRSRYAERQEVYLRREAGETLDSDELQIAVNFETRKTGMRDNHRRLKAESKAEEEAEGDATGFCHRKYNHQAAYVWALILGYNQDGSAQACSAASIPKSTTDRRHTNTRVNVTSRQLPKPNCGRCHMSIGFATSVR